MALWHSGLHHRNANFKSLWLKSTFANHITLCVMYAQLLGRFSKIISDYFRYINWLHTLEISTEIQRCEKPWKKPMEMGMFHSKGFFFLLKGVKFCHVTSCAFLALQAPSGPQTLPIWHLQIFGRPTPVVMQSAPKPQEVSASRDMKTSSSPRYHLTMHDNAGKATASLENAFQKISHSCFPWLWPGGKMRLMSHQVCLETSGTSANFSK